MAILGVPCLALALSSFLGTLGCGCTALLVSALVLGRLHGLHLLEDGCALQQIRHHHELHLTAAQEYLLQFGHAAVPRRHRDCREREIIDDG